MVRLPEACCIPAPSQERVKMMYMASGKLLLTVSTLVDEMALLKKEVAEMSLLKKEVAELKLKQQLQDDTSKSYTYGIIYLFY